MQHPVPRVDNLGVTLPIRCGAGAAAAAAGAEAAQAAAAAAVGETMADKAYYYFYKFYIMRGILSPGLTTMGSPFQSNAT